MKKTIVILIFPFLLGAQEIKPQTSDVYIELILDASGSMEEQISGKTKMEIAKDVLSRYAKKVNQEYQVGLRVYGNTKRKDCKDTHLIVNIAKNNRDQIISEIKDIEPLSMTPIATSLQKASEDLKPLKDKGTLGIVLVTDGMESCDKNPCQVAKDIIKSGLPIKINVVGFDIHDKEAHEQLKCIAKATGGTYVTSDNADSLYKMLEKSVEEAARFHWNLKVETPSNLNYAVTVIDEKTGKVVLDKKLAYYSHLLPDGTYTIKVDTKPEYIEKGVQLTQAKQTIIKVKKMGVLKVKTLSDLNFYVTAKDTAGNVVINRKYAFNAYDLPEGIYTLEVVSENGRIHWTKNNVEVKENQRTEIPMAGYGWLKVDTGRLGLTCQVTLKYEPTGKTEVKDGYTSGAFIVPTGPYTAELYNERSRKKFTLKNLVVNENQNTTVPHVCQ
ncbi:MAG: VWA domain-containing protein [Deltaproteobacteria bacterium]|nr:VWA domain-containing protein [Deltaproteobacteria bacterium]